MTTKNRWIELVIISEYIFEDLIYSTLYDFKIDTFEIIDYKTIVDFKNIKPDWVIMEDGLIAENDYLTIKIYLDEKEFDWERINNIKLSLFYISNNIKVIDGRTIEDTDWSIEWKKHYKPFKVGKNIIIKPSWEKFNNINNNIVIEIDPGMAFGTGTHETTSLCLEMLETLPLDNTVVYDVGTGSGILSIASAKLGAKDVIAIDIDPLSIEATKINTSLNNVNDIVSVYEGDLLNLVTLKGDIIIANILPDIIIKVVPDVRRLINNDGFFIASGILKDKAIEVINCLTNNHFKVINTVEKGEWVCILSQIENE